MVKKNFFLLPCVSVYGPKKLSYKIPYYKERLGLSFGVIASRGVSRSVRGFFPNFFHISNSSRNIKLHSIG